MTRWIAVVLFLGWVATAGAFTPDTWRPGPLDVSLGNVAKQIDPRTGGPCDQHCRLFRIFERMNQWLAAVDFTQEAFPDVGSVITNQLSPSQGYAFVAGEIQDENTCQAWNGCLLADGTRPATWPPDGTTLQAHGAWSEGPDYDFNGNVKPRMTELQGVLIKKGNAYRISLPTPIMQTFDIGGTPGNYVVGNPDVAAARPTRPGCNPKKEACPAQLAGPCLAPVDGVRWCKSGRKQCTTDKDCIFQSALQNVGILDNAIGCEAITPAQDKLLQAVLDSHMANGAYAIAHDGAPRPGGSQEFFGAVKAFEDSAKDLRQLMLFELFPFPNTRKLTRPASERMQLEHEVHLHMERWADHIRTCPTDPVVHLTGAWFENHLHRDYHTFLATNFGPRLVLRLPCMPDPPKVSLKGALTLDQCPNATFPPPGFHDTPF